MSKPGEVTQRTVLNVFGSMGPKGRYILDSLKTGAVRTDFYTDADLKIGIAFSLSQFFILPISSLLSN